eukprot:6201392-Pleurochrysis_carterae.AAC.6
MFTTCTPDHQRGASCPTKEQPLVFNASFAQVLEERLRGRGTETEEKIQASDRCKIGTDRPARAAAACVGGRQ